MGIFGISRKKVKDVRRKEALETLKRRKAAEKLERKTQKEKAEASYYRAKSERKRAKQEASFKYPILPTARIKLRKKKQGGKLSRKSRIRLI